MSPSSTGLPARRMPRISHSLSRVMSSLVSRLAIAIHPLSGLLPMPVPRSSTRRVSSSLPLPWSGVVRWASGADPSGGDVRIMPTDELQQVVQLAHDKGVRVYVDDAGGARVGPAIFLPDQPRTLQSGVDVVATGLDKYGTAVPRLGVTAGQKSLVSAYPCAGLEMGLEARPFLHPAAVRSYRRGQRT